MSGTRLAITVQRAVAPGGSPRAADIRRWVRAAAGPEASGEVTVRIVGEEEAAALNERYRGRHGPTNVLAFSGEAVGEGEPPLLGDLVVCAPLVEREAREQGKGLESHWAHIVMHGTLHLVGFDHEEGEAAREMEARERQLMARFGFLDPYAAGAP